MATYAVEFKSESGIFGPINSWVLLATVKCEQRLFTQLLKRVQKDRGKGVRLRRDDSLEAIQSFDGRRFRQYG